MKLEEAKQFYRIDQLAEQAGYKLKRAGATEKMLICPSPSHNDTNASCSINTEKNVFRCLGCGVKGSVIDWVMLVEGCSLVDALKRLGVDERESMEKSTKNGVHPQSHVNATYTPPVAKAGSESPTAKKWLPEPKYRTARYKYNDEAGRLKYFVDRFDYPDGQKSFMPSHISDNGATVLGLKDVQRIPYNYDTFNDTDTLFFVEGEKCADAVTNCLGLPSTTTCNGSKSWQKEYAEYFSGKTLIIIPDNDNAGRDFAKTVAADCSSKAEKVIILDLFNSAEYEEKWDIADECVEEGENLDAYRQYILDEVEKAPSYICGIRVEASNASQMTARLKARYKDWQNGGLDLKAIFPVLSDRAIRPLVGGDLLIINAPTGAGKTSLAQLIAVEYNEYPVPWFSLELSETRMHERNLIMSNEIEAEELERMLINDEHVNTELIDHIYVIDNAMANLSYIDKQLSLFPLITGRKPRMAVIDYIQLMPSEKGLEGIGDYQRISMNATGLKVLAKIHNIVLVVVSQIGRKEEANLGAAKGSGAIEESGTMVIGLNNMDGYSDVKSLGIYKNSNGEKNFTEVIGFEGKYYKFSCTATNRMAAHRLEEEIINGDATENPF